MQKWLKSGTQNGFKRGPKITTQCVQNYHKDDTKMDSQISKTAPNGFKNSPKMNLKNCCKIYTKPYQNDTEMYSKVAQKWPQNYATLTLNWYQNDTKMIIKMTLKLHQKYIRNCHKNDIKMTSKWHSIMILEITSKWLQKQPKWIQNDTIGYHATPI